MDLILSTVVTLLGLVFDCLSFYRANAKNVNILDCVAFVLLHEELIVVGHAHEAHNAELYYVT